MAHLEEIITRHFLYPGAILAERSPHQVTTILGSCVAVCLYDPVKQMGGINHFMMPLWNGTGLSSPKYGNIAIEKLILKMGQMGSDPQNLKAKVFGGASQMQYKSQSFNIGERNINLAMSMLKEYGIRVVGKSLGGNLGRKIIFNTQSGEVLMRYVKGNQLEK